MNRPVCIPDAYITLKVYFTYLLTLHRAPVRLHNTIYCDDPDVYAEPTY